MFENSFPKYLEKDLNVVLKLLPTKTHNNVRDAISDNSVTYKVNGKNITFPYRLYLNDVSNTVINQLSNTQRMILHCIYTRSCDGFVRESHIKRLLCMNYEEWAIPYILKLSDEYIVEILEVIYIMLNYQDTNRYKKICLENKTLFCKSYNRMISYWNEYYRIQHPHFKDYIGRKLFRECFGYSRSLEK
ncbi:MAG: hypothetical protein ACK5LC_07780 [Coprobacillaceae bacterium]